MAELTATEIQQLRLLAEDPSAAEFDANTLQAIWDLAGSMYASAYLIWTVKAGRLYKKVNASSGNNRIEFASQYDHAVQQAEQFLNLAGGVEGISGGGETFESVAMANTADFGSSDFSEYTWNGIPLPAGWFDIPPVIP